MSYWATRRPVHRQRAVDVDALARAAVHLLDGGGISALTVRAVAAALGVAPASLYSRVRSVEDVLDLALDAALAQDRAMQEALGVPSTGEPHAGQATALEELLVLYFRHLRRHPWATHVISQRAPRGPHYLRLSERLCVLLDEAGAPDPLGAAYALSNFVIGSAATSSIDDDEKAAPVDPDIAPRYAQLHAEHVADSEKVVALGVTALCSALIR